MRTTLTLDDDVADSPAVLSRRHGKPLEQIEQLAVEDLTAESGR